MSIKIPVPSKEELIELYNQSGISISELARRYNTSNPTIRKWLQSYDIKRKSHKQISTEVNQSKKYKVPDRDTFMSLYKNNSIKFLESYYGVSQETIYYWLNVLDIKKVSSSDKLSLVKTRNFIDSLPSKDDIIKLYNKEKNIKKTADVIGISSSYLRKYLHDNNIEIIKNWISVIEQEIFDYCISVDPDGDWIQCDRTLINPYELDIVSHKRKIAIEYCGLYWHSELSGNKTSTYHATKRKMCEDKGYKLLTIFESDDMNKVYNLLNHLIGSNEKIYARNTDFRIIDNDTSKIFNDKFHMHDDHNASIKTGLYHNDELVMVATFGKSRYNKSYDYECIRMTSHGNYRIVGGVSKIIKNTMKIFDMKSIITYADLRFGDGNTYIQSGFEYSHESPPNYWYFNKKANKLHSRVQFQKHKLKYKLEYFDSNLTEWENMKMNNWDRIWDCGNKVYFMVNKTL